ncbi:hypothetical protein QEJ31_10275 [Pigmentibacter sp. JX0631]|uniref:S10 family serine carboxypeptidase-like protein n=1 Tax=Pigmentibacter sp. JX0631 TaxID=2976982 RepID=UPI0024696B1B|nr:hypothetical protein [Pigmentibacter sp. JX0631]WGL58908.1 hypothetical protein QEJ31_10275 [Pigmentibacter sp. JX0631]
MNKISFSYQKKIFIFLVVINFTSCGRNDSSGQATNSPIYSLPNGGITNDITENNSFYFDPILYGKNENDNITDRVEDLTFANDKWISDKKNFNYITSVGHIVTLDSENGKPNAKIFYIAYSLNDNSKKNRPITFVLNGGPGQTQFLSALSAFSPKTINKEEDKLVNNKHSILEKTDLVFVSPVGTGLSSAIAPYVNKNFWGVDHDAKSMMEFILRFQEKNLRQESPIYLMGDSYGSIRAIISAKNLYTKYMKVKGLILLSPLINYSNWLNPVGVFPTIAVNAWYHKKLSQELMNKPFNEFMKEVIDFTKSKYYPCLNFWRDNYKDFINLVYNNPDKDTALLLKNLIKSSSSYDEIVLILKNGNFYQKNLAEKIEKVINLLQPMDWDLASIASNYSNILPKIFRDLTELNYNKRPFFDLLNFHLTSLLAEDNNSISAYDGRKISNYKRISFNDILQVDNDSDFLFYQNKMLDLWNNLLNTELHYYSASEFITKNENVEKIWDFHHINAFNTLNDNIFDLNFYYDFLNLINLNSELKIFIANGIYDSVTPFYQNVIDLKIFLSDEVIIKNIKMINYNSGHFIYLDPVSKDLLQNDIKDFYD